MGPRLSITKQQRETTAATELIQLCQTVAEDGHLEEQEVLALRDWLNVNRQADLPAVGFLVETVERILDDGKVTRDEARALYQAIETVLPPDIRASVRGTRTAQEKATKEAAREAREAERQAQREAQARNRPVETLDFMVAGAAHEGRAEVISQAAKPQQPVYLVREPGNRHSRNAVAVFLEAGQHVGYIPEHLAAEVAPLLDGGHKVVAEIKKILHGRNGPIPVVIAQVFRPDSDVSAPKPPERTAPRHTISRPAGRPAHAGPGAARPAGGCFPAAAVMVVVLTWALYTLGLR